MKYRIIGKIQICTWTIGVVTAVGVGVAVSREVSAVLVSAAKPILACVSFSAWAFSNGTGVLCGAIVVRCAWVYRAVVVHRGRLVVVNILVWVATSLLGHHCSTGADTGVPLALDRILAVFALWGSPTAAPSKEGREARANCISRSWRSRIFGRATSRLFAFILARGGKRSSNREE